jgi:ATP-dependent exoDNAse (exonuclease V) alpha subunit
LNPTLNTEQKEAFKAIQKFIEHPAANTFVLKGFAGTGKTFLMQYLARWLEEKEIDFSLLASTGRAATVLRGKTGFPAKTVHGELYHFSKVEGVEDDLSENAPIEKHGQMTLQFLLRKPDQTNKIYIVDEASMLSSEQSLDTINATFGSGYLMTDFFAATGKSKIIFVGDPGQLPPVGQAFSPALDINWLNQNKRVAITCSLQKIERHNGDNGILSLSTRIRNMHNEPVATNYPKIPASNLNNVQIHSSQNKLLQKYIEKFKEAGARETIAIARSNRMVQDINTAVRRDLYDGLDMPLQVGDILLVIQNNYAVPLTNGDFVTVCGLGAIQTNSNLHFQSVRVKAMASDKDYELLLSLDILYNTGSTNFTEEQLKKLMIDFNFRMRNKGVRGNSEAYKDEMMKDAFLNCLKAKYGYAATCHKAQGGEWNNVFLFLEKGMYAMKQPELFRWWYTAVTRARQELNLSSDWWIA